ncbi:MAG TPA: hypothetical protein PKD12_01880 [Nitrospira sp.]|nr:hypothetical protein [Nitrospira sp.]
MIYRGLLNAGVLSVVATTVLFTTSTVFPSDKPSVSGGGMELKPKTSVQEKLNVKDLDEEVSHLEVVDSKGNAYLLIPLRTTGVNKPVVAEDGKIIVEYVHPYTGRLGN